MMIDLIEKYRIKPFAKQDILMISIVLLFGLVNFFWGEVIPYGRGFGWDGQTYREIARDLTGSLLSKTLPEYRLQRIVPSGIVHYGLRLGHIPIQDSSILKGFRLFNLGSIVLAAYLYVLICSELKFNSTGKWLGFFGLFVNFANSRQYFYYPTLTDQFGFLLAMLMLYFFLKNNRLGSIITTLVGAFTWPPLLLYGVLLYLFPRQTNEEVEKNSRLAQLVAGLAACMLLVWLVWLHDVRNVGVPNGAVQVVESVVYLSLICALAYVFLGLKTALDNIGLPGVRSIVGSTSAGRLAVGLLLVILVRTVLVLFAGPRLPFDPSLFEFLQIASIESIVRPLGFLVAHVIYFGPILLLTLFLWRPFTRIISGYGIGLCLLVLGSFALSLESESRHLLAALPFFVIFTVKAAEELRWNSNFLWFMVILSILYSKMWLRMNTETFTGDLLQFPFQYYLMSVGPWMSNQMYIVQGVIVLATGIIMLALIKNPAPENI